ncbi:DUF3828 domain-containing protein [Rouxiella sp. Mn2063]|uniref:DUF3828 domain-containing protein n=1 Tax=Rouxiella sp. Mn2063 TaxID=3395262 RepID=UPI003BD508A9
MLKKAFCLCCLLFLSNAPFAANRNASSPENIVRNFYHDYLTAWNMPDVKEGLKKSHQAVDTYTTKHLKILGNANNSGTDYFTHSQDICPEWENNINTKEISINSHVAAYRVDLGYGKSMSSFTVHLIKQHKRWMLDSVEFDGRESGICNQ